MEERAKNDPLFASVYAKPNKNINECFDYILSEAKKRGNAVCMSDDEVFGLAVHYYDEDDIKVSKQTNYKAATSQAPKVMWVLHLKKKPVPWKNEEQA